MRWMRWRALRVGREHVFRGRGEGPPALPEMGPAERVPVERGGLLRPGGRPEARRDVQVDRVPRLPVHVPEQGHGRDGRPAGGDLIAIK